MLHLTTETSPEWTQRAVEQLDTLLLDHAHCEKKAASTALSLIFRYPEQHHMLRPLSEIAREELEHFELVLGHLEVRGILYERLVPSPYAGQLLKVVRSSEPDRLLDTLLCCAAIEARSCERMKLLADALPEGPVQALYAGLLACEAKHHMIYVDMASEIFKRAEVMARLAEVMAHESTVLQQPMGELRMHS